MDKKAMYKLTYGLFVLTANEDGKDNGCIINTAIQAAGEPNQVSISVSKKNYTHDMIMRTGKFTVSSLTEKADFSKAEKTMTNSLDSTAGSEESVEFPTLQKAAMLISA